MKQRYEHGSRRRKKIYSRFEKGYKKDVVCVNFMCVRIRSENGIILQNFIKDICTIYTYMCVYIVWFCK